MNKSLLRLLCSANLAVALCVGGSGCATDSTQTIQGDTAAHVRNFIEKIEPGLKPAAFASCSIAFLAVPADDLAYVKRDLYTVASIIDAASVEQTPGDLSKSIQAVLPPGELYKTLADSIAGTWAIALPYIKGDIQLTVKVTGDIAGGIRLAAGPVPGP